MAAKFKNKYSQIISLIIIFSAIFLSIYNLFQTDTKVLGYDTSSDDLLFQKKEYWEELLAKNPTYYDGWQQLYIINKLMGNNKEASKALEYARRIDNSR